MYLPLPPPKYRRGLILISLILQTVRPYRATLAANKNPRLKAGDFCLKRTSKILLFYKTVVAALAFMLHYYGVEACGQGCYV